MKISIRAVHVMMQGETLAGRTFARRVFALVLVAATLLMAGCSSGQYNYATTIGTGERLVFPLVNGRPQMTKKGSIEILNAALLPNPTPGVTEHLFLFAYRDDTGVTPKSVVVEDVSDQRPIMMVEDNEPKLVENGQWRGFSRSMKGNDPAVYWLAQLGETMRVYRFTITKPDGTTTVIHQGWMVPTWLKAMMRQMFGLPQL